MSSSNQRPANMGFRSVLRCAITHYRQFPSLSAPEPYVMMLAVLLSIGSLGKAVPQAEAVGICDRTVQVREAILNQIGGADSCSAVTDADLAAVTGTLNLEDAGLSSLRAGDFSGLTGLQSLYLGYNQLTALPADIFSGLANLGGVRLTKNKLQALPSGVFAGLVNLDVLDLEYNELQTLPVGAFGGLNLLFLGLEANQFQSLPVGVFDSLSVRLALDLSDNKLETLPAGLFAGLGTLSSLDLENNQLETLPAGVFAGLTSLRALKLDGNPGADFTFTMTVTRVPGRNSVVVTVPQGTPFDMRTSISATGGTLPPGVSSVTVSVGHTTSDEIAVVPLEGTTVSLGAAPPVPSEPPSPGSNTRRFTGIASAVGDPVTFEEPSLTVGMTIDTMPPVEGAFTVRFSFSETVAGFTSSDIETRQEPPCTDSANNPVSCNPTMAALQTTDDRIFTTTVTPRTDQVAHNYTLTFTVPAGRVTSAAGNKPNEEATLEMRVAPPGVTVPISSIGLTANPGNSQVTLRWNTPQNTGGPPIVRYEYRWAESGGEFSAWVSVGPAERAVTVHNLTNGREYMFEVRPVNALGYGLVTTARAAARSGGGGPPGGGGPRQTVPGAPINLVADATDGAVTLTWEAPENDGGSEITDYEVRINGRGSWISIGSTHTAHTVTGLTNGTVYVFQVRAVNAAGSSPYSNRAEATPGVGTLDFAHFANGAGIISDLVFVNVATHPIRPALYFYDKEGQPMDPESVVDLTGELEVTEDGALSIQTEMEPLGELTISTHGQGVVVSGSVQVVSDGPIGGVLRFDLPAIGGAGVGASQPVRDVIFPARRRGGLSTAVAIRNLGEEALGVSCRLMSGGMVLEEAEIPLEANGQEARYIEELFPLADTSDFVGSVRCTALGLFTGVAVELDAGNRIFTTLPVVPVERAADSQE